MCSVELQCIESSFHCKFCRCSELFYDLMDTFYCKCLWSFQFICLIKEVRWYKTAVPNLYGCFSTIIMDCFCYFLKFVSVMLIVKSEVQISMTFWTDRYKLYYI